MLTFSTKSLNALRRDDRGSILPLFGIMFAFVMLAAGAAVDAGRVYDAQSRLASAADAAAIAAGKALLDGRNSDAEVVQIATQYFNANLSTGADNTVAVNSFNVTVDRATNTVKVDLAADVSMTLTRIAGFDKVDFPVTSVATFQQQDIELSMALDLTGSMSGIKIATLRSATNDLLDILLPDAGTPNKVRVAFAPYSYGVNAGSLAAAATNNRSANGCTFERQGSTPEGDQAPSANNYLSVSGDVHNAGCPSAKVIALSSDKALLKSTVNGFTASGSTAGHTGAAWASYLVSPHWSGVVGSESVPVAYHDGRTIKAVVIMTDGENNTFAGVSDGRNSVVHRDLSDALEQRICTEMKTNGVIVFTVAFTAGAAPLDATAQTLLSNCATDSHHFFMAADQAALHQAFTDIANTLNHLRLSK